MKKYHSRIALVLVMSIVISFYHLPVFVRAASEEDNILTSGDWSYKLLEDGSSCITKYRGSDANLCIPDEIDGYKVTGIGNEVFYQNEKLVSVEFPDTVESIGDYAFQCCENLRGELVLPKNLKKIGNDAFQECKFTGDLKIPEGVEEIGAYAFYQARFTGDLTLPSSVKKIGQYAFRMCRYMKGTLTLPEGITKIEEGVFQDCGFTGTLKIPRSVTEIEETAFHSTSEISKIVIPRETTWISETAFLNLHPVTIYGYSGSAAQTYADTYQIPFVDLEATPLSTEEPTPSPSTLPTPLPVTSPTTPTQTPKKTEPPTQMPEKTEPPTQTPNKTEHPPSDAGMPSAQPFTGNRDDANTGTSRQDTGILSRKLQMTGVQGVPDDYPKMKWNQNPYATGYEIYRSRKKNAGYQKIQLFTSAQTEFVDRKAKRGKSYYYKIRAVYDKVTPMITGEFSGTLRLKRQYLNTPVLKLKRVGKNGKTAYLKLTVRKSEGKKIQIYFQKGKKKKIVRLRSKKIKRVYRLQYKSSAKHMTFQIRTYVKKGKRICYSRFAVIKI